MAGKKKKLEIIPNKEVTEIQVAPRPELVLEGDPEKQLEFAQKAAKALMSVVNQKQKKVIIGGKTYIEYGDWQTLARFFGSTVGIDWTKPYEEHGEKVGWEARAIVYRDGVVISSAEAMCTIKDKNWGSRDDFQRRSMAQTRAASKALRNAFGWVAELAGYASTPAEEMDGVFDRSPVPENVVPTVTYDDPEQEDPDTEGNKIDIPSSVVEQKKIIFQLLRLRGVDVRDGKACKTYVADNTQLELVVANYPEIIKILAN